MKKQILILISIISILFSCKEKEKEVITPDYANSVIGNYQVLRLELNGKIAILPSANVSAGVSIKALDKNKVSTTLTVISSSNKVVYNFVASTLRKDNASEIINFDYPYIGNYDTRTKRLELATVTEAGETVKLIGFN